MDPLGVRNNNPLNLRPGSAPWQGQVAVRDGYCVFDSPRNGIRAGAKQLRVYQNIHGCKTIAEMISRWAPPLENDTVAYILDVCRRTGLAADVEIDLSDHVLLRNLVTAIIWHENGCEPYAAAVIQAGVDAAYSWP